MAKAEALANLRIDLNTLAGDVRELSKLIGSIGRDQAHLVSRMGAVELAMRNAPTQANLEAVSASSGAYARELAGRLEAKVSGIGARLDSLAGRVSTLELDAGPTLPLWFRLTRRLAFWRS